MMEIFFVFICSFLFCVLLVFSKPFHIRLSSDTVVGPQKFHEGSVPRIGGCAIFASLILGCSIFELPELAGLFLMACFPIFVFGFIEDLFKCVPSLYRLCASFASSILLIYLTGTYFSSVDIVLFDKMFNIMNLWPFLTVLSLSALINSINMIDGLNGLASGTSIFMALSIAVLSYQHGDAVTLQLSLFFAATVMGFFVVNFPKGLLFLGDSGAYISGLFLGGLAINLIETNPDISLLSLLIVFAYPITELLFSVYRKSVRDGHRPDKPDKVHFHMLVHWKYRKRFAMPLLQKSVASAMLLLFPLSGLVFVTIMPITKTVSLLYFLIFAFLYLRLYRYLSLNG